MVLLIPNETVIRPLFLLISRCCAQYEWEFVICLLLVKGVNQLLGRILQPNEPAQAHYLDDLLGNRAIITNNQLPGIAVQALFVIREAH